MKILVADSQNKREMIEINENESIENLKEKIKVKMGINTDIILHYNGEILEENQLVSDCDLEENCVIVFMGKFRGGILCKEN